MCDKNSKNGDSAFQYEEIEHTADAALRVRGENFKVLLKNAACGMASIIHESDAGSNVVVQRRVHVCSDDPEGLLVEWLGELAYLAETESLVFESCEFEKVDQTAIHAQASLRKVQNLKAYIKAVTYNNLEIVETASGLEATVVFDL